jgi:hypothetical protein
MTYLIIGNKEENIKREIQKLLNKLWEREIKEDILNRSNPDIHILLGSNLDSMGIEDVKELQKEMVFSPYKELIQVALIFNAEKLTIQAQNSFLKTLEDTNDNTAYILVTNNEKHLLPTILSRTLKIYTQEQREKLKDLNITKILEMDLVNAFENIEKISKEKENTQNFLKQLELYFQNQLEEKLQKEQDFKKIYNHIQKIIRTRQRVQANGNRRLLLENLFLHLTSKGTY